MAIRVDRAGAVTYHIPACVGLNRTATPVKSDGAGPWAGAPRCKLEEILKVLLCSVPGPASAPIAPTTRDPSSRVGSVGFGARWCFRIRTSPGSALIGLVGKQSGLLPLERPIPRTTI
jgi:hypothetical protein